VVKWRVGDMSVVALKLRLVYRLKQHGVMHEDSS
jgi:hypothetical protein